MRTAKCSCGQLSISLNGEPEHVFICHCRECQLVTGSAFGVSTYWPRTAVAEMTGRSTSYTRSSFSGRSLTNHFCPVCGGRPYWFAEFLPGHVGVALGCFGQDDLPAPKEEYWTSRKHPWVSFACSLKSFVGDD